MITVFVIAYNLLALHAPDGREIDINPSEITSLREQRPNDSEDKTFTKTVRCMINLTDGKFVSVTESCQAIRGMISEKLKKDNP